MALYDTEHCTHARMLLTGFFLLLTREVTDFHLLLPSVAMILIYVHTSTNFSLYIFATVESRRGSMVSPMNIHTGIVMIAFMTLLFKVLAGGRVWLRV